MTTKTAEQLWEEMRKERAYDLKTLKVTPLDPTLSHGGGWVQCGVSFNVSVLTAKMSHGAV